MDNTNTRLVRVACANPTYRGRSIQFGCIEITHPLPDEPEWSMQDWRTYYRQEAVKIVDVLMHTLPQGAMHELLVTLMTCYGSVYQGPTVEVGPLTVIDPLVDNARTTDELTPRREGTHG